MDPQFAALAAVPAKYAQPDPSTLAKLPKPTKRDNPKGKCDVCGGYHGLPAVHLDYMGHADITLALIDVDPCWTWEPVAIDPETGGPVIATQGNRLVMWGWLIVHGVRRLCVGTCETSKGDPEKELIGDLLRNGAMRFGIATKLWSKSDSADPAGSGATGGYERRPARRTPQHTQTEPTEHQRAARAVIDRVRALDDDGKAALKEWADGRSLAVPALVADEKWLEFVEERLDQMEAGVAS